MRPLKPFEKICENIPNYSLPRELVMTLKIESHKQGKKPSELLREILYEVLEIPEDVFDEIETCDAEEPKYKQLVIIF